MASDRKWLVLYREQRLGLLESPSREAALAEARRIECTLRPDRIFVRETM